jgi:hypothetical protein
MWFFGVWSFVTAFKGMAELLTATDCSSIDTRITFELHTRACGKLFELFWMPWMVFASWQTV